MTRSVAGSSTFSAESTVPPDGPVRPSTASTLQARAEGGNAAARRAAKLAAAPFSPPSTITVSGARGASTSAKNAVTSAILSGTPLSMPPGL